MSKPITILHFLKTHKSSRATPPSSSALKQKRKVELSFGSPVLIMHRHQDAFVFVKMQFHPRSLVKKYIENKMHPFDLCQLTYLVSFEVQIVPKAPHARTEYSACHWPSRCSGVRHSERRCRARHCPRALPGSVDKPRQFEGGQGVVTPDVTLALTRSFLG